MPASTWVRRSPVVAPQRVQGSCGADSWAEAPQATVLWRLCPGQAAGAAWYRGEPLTSAIPPHSNLIPSHERLTPAAGNSLR